MRLTGPHVRGCARKRLSTIPIGIGIGMDFGCAWLIRLQLLKPTVFDAEADHDADPKENRPSRKRAARIISAVCVVLLVAANGRAVAFAQPDAEEQLESEENLSARDKLAREFTDPLTSLPQVFLQDAVTPENYGTEAVTNRAVARIIIPRVPRFTLLPLVQLIRPSFFLVTVPKGKGKATRTEFGDMQLFDAFVSPWPPPGSGLRIGLGPTFVFPTATDRRAGQGAWQVGPLFAALYKGIPWLIAGVLIQNPISFAYTDDDRRPVNALAVQPVLLVSVGHGWYLKSADASWVFSWRDQRPKTIPLSFGVGRVLVREGLPPLNFFVSGEWMAYRESAPVAAQTTIRVGMTIAFPGYRPW